MRVIVMRRMEVGMIGERGVQVMDEIHGSQVGVVEERGTYKIFVK